jgi:hypothetical protein
MPPIILKAHFDGQRIVLDQPFELPNGTSLIVTVLPRADEAEHAEWSRAAAAGLARAYSDDEPEYSLSDVKK